MTKSNNSQIVSLEDQALAAVRVNSESAAKRTMSIMDKILADRPAPLKGIVEVSELHLREWSTGDRSGFALDGKIAGRKVSAVYVGQIGRERLERIVMQAVQTYPGSDIEGRSMNLYAATKVVGGREYLDLDSLR